VEVETEYCPECKKEQIIVEAGSNFGYCGRIYWVKLACGHQIVDASDDVPEM